MVITPNSENNLSFGHIKAIYVIFLVVYKKAAYTIYNG
jgi:hypothetical protein